MFLSTNYSNLYKLSNFFNIKYKFIQLKINIDYKYFQILDNI